MRTQHIDMKDAGKVILAQARQVEPAVIRGLRMAARRGETLMIEQSQEFSDLGIFASMWDVRQTPKGALLFNDAPHAAPLELGRRAAYPPLLPIFEYLGRKRGISTAGVGESMEWDLRDQWIFQERPDLEELRLLAVAVGRYLGTHNLPGKHLQRGARIPFSAFTRQEIERQLKACERKPAAGAGGAA